MSVYIFSLLVVGLILLTVTLGSGWISHLPVSYALIYLIAGFFLKTYIIAFLNARPSADFIEHLTEFVVIVSVFGCGLKMNRPLTLPNWRSPIRLLGLLMPLSILAIAVVAHVVLGFSWGAAILIGAILAPTDPVLASDVQLTHLEDRDEVRFSLTSEGGLNDSLAFPFVYFGIKAIQDSQWQNWLQQWFLIDVVWAIAAGVVMGFGVARAILWLDRRMQQSRPAETLMEDLVALSAILLTYAFTELINGYGFLAVFVAGVTIRKSYRTHPHRKEAQLHFIEQFEKLLEVATILLLGALLNFSAIAPRWFEGVTIAVFLLFIIRPLGTRLCFWDSKLPPSSQWLTGWFGIRGVGSVYYLTYAMGEGLSRDLSERIGWIVYLTIALSIIVHGVTASPLMHWYEGYRKSRQI